MLQLQYQTMSQNKVGVEKHIQARMETSSGYITQEKLKAYYMAHSSPPHYEMQIKHAKDEYITLFPYTVVEPLQKIINKHEFLLLYGPSGCGKTTAIVHTMDAYRKQGYNVEYANLRDIAEDEMMSQLKSIVFIDDAQHLSPVLAGYFLNRSIEGLAHIVFISSEGNVVPAFRQGCVVGERLTRYHLIPFGTKEFSRPNEALICADTEDVMLQNLAKCGVKDVKEVYNIIGHHLTGLKQCVEK